MTDLKNKPEDELGIFETKKEPRKGFATFFRNQNKLYVNSMNMIDRKSSMMIRLNTSIISVIVVFFEHISEINNGVFMGVVMVVFSFVSLAFALFASKPNSNAMMRYHAKKVKVKYPNIEENIFFLGMHYILSLDEYEEAYDKIVKNQNLQIGNQVRAMYLLEKYTVFNFRLIDLSYAFFIIGFVVITISFIISNI